MTIRWISSSRLGDAAALEPLAEVAGLLNKALGVYGASQRVLEAVAEAEQWVRTVMETFGARYVAGIALKEAVSTILGDYLDDSAHVLFHSNLRRLIDRYGIAPYLDDALARSRVYQDPVPTQFPLPYGVDWFRTQASRLGSSTLLGLEQPPLETGFEGWQAEVADAFYDRGDWQRPAYSGGERLAALAITVQAVDPVELFDSFSTLIRLFSKRPPGVVLPDLAQFAGDIWKSADLLARPINGLPAVRYLRPYLTSESWNTPPDFTRVGTQDLIPLLGDVLLDFRMTAGVFGRLPPSSGALEGFATSLAHAADHYEQILREISEVLNTLLALLSQPGFSRLWIPLGEGGTDRLVSEFLAAGSTREDLQRVVERGESPHARNSLIPYADAVTTAATYPAFRFTPAENLLVAGTMIVLHEGPLATLIANLLAPKAADEAEHDGGPPVTASAGGMFSSNTAVEMGEVPLAASGRNHDPSRPAPGPEGGPANPSTQERTGWVDTPLRGEAPAGVSLQQAGPFSIRAKSHRPTLFSYEGSRAMQLVLPGAPRGTLLRRVGDLGWEGDATAVVLAAETRAVPTIAKGRLLIEPRPYPTSSSSSSPWSGVGGRCPVGTSPVAPEQRAASMLPLDALSTSARPDVHPPSSVEVEVAPAGAYLTSTKLVSLVVAAGYTGGEAEMEALLPGKPLWWLDVQVDWKTYLAGEVSRRRAWVRVRLDEVDDSSGEVRFTTVPALPSPPLVEGGEMPAIVWAGGAMGFARALPPRGEAGTRSEYVERGAPGVGMESLVTWRRGLSPGPEKGTWVSLQADVLGVIVDADCGEVGARREVVFAAAPGAPGLRYHSPEIPVLPEGGMIYSETPLPPGGMRAIAGASEASPVELRPAAAAAAAYARIGTGAGYYAYSRRGDLASQEHQVSGSVGVLAEDTRLLSVFAPRHVRIGLGEVSLSATSLPSPLRGAPVVVVTVDEATGRWERHADAIDLVAAAGGSVVPSATWAADHVGEPWAIDVEWDTQAVEIVGTLVPDIRVSADPASMYDGQRILDPAIADHVLVPAGAPVQARMGAPAVGDVSFGSSGHLDGEGAWCDLPLLAGRSRLPAGQQAVEVRLSFVPLRAWTGAGLSWVLLESATHSVVLRSDVELTAEVYERDVLSGVRVHRLSVHLPDVLPGAPHRVGVHVDPASRQIRLRWWGSSGGFEDEPSYVLYADETVEVGSTDPYPYARALDGYPLTGATIRVGRPLPPLMTEARVDRPYADDVTVATSEGTTAQQWAWGAPPIALVAAEAGAPLP